MRRILLSFAVILTSAQGIWAQYEIDSWRFKPQLGIWFGPATPLPGTKLSQRLSTSLGGGLFFRLNLPSDTWRTEVAFGYTYYTSSQTSRLHSFPFYGAIVTKLPFDLPVHFHTRFGLGGTYVVNRPENKANTLPMAIAGLEFSFPAGKYVSIGARGDYMFVLEQHLQKPADNPDFELTNGHFLKFGLSVTFNLGGV